MDERWLRSLLENHRDGGVSTDQALQALRHFPVEELGFASIDTHRTLRRGFPEVVLARGKRTEHLLGIVERMLEHGHNVLVTRASVEQIAALRETFPGEQPEVHEGAGTVVFRKQPVEEVGRGTVLILSAGTADLPVAEEALVTTTMMGNRAELIVDVGVAGLHRLLRHRERIAAAEVVIVVAGMDAALPSVVAGLVDRPVIAVPTSTGYGAAFEGIAALLAALNACAAGVTVVNIDNGFGAGYAASLINRRRRDTAGPEGA